MTGGFEVEGIRNDQHDQAIGRSPSGDLTASLCDAIHEFPQPHRGVACRRASPAAIQWPHVELVHWQTQRA